MMMNNFPDISKLTETIEKIVLKVTSEKINDLEERIVQLNARIDDIKVFRDEGKSHSQKFLENCRWKMPVSEQDIGFNESTDKNFYIDKDPNELVHIQASDLGILTEVIKTHSIDELDKIVTKQMCNNEVGKPELSLNDIENTIIDKDANVILETLISHHLIKQKDDVDPENINNNLLDERVKSVDPKININELVDLKIDANENTDSEMYHKTNEAKNKLSIEQEDDVSIKKINEIDTLKEKRFICDECDYTSKLKANLIRHFRKHKRSRQKKCSTKCTTNKCIKGTTKLDCTKTCFRFYNFSLLKIGDRKKN